MTAIFLAAMLATADAVLEAWLTARVARPDFRFPVRSMAGYPELLADAKADPRPKVLFVGDSILQGSALDGGGKTIVYGYYRHRVERETDPPRILNLSAAGSSVTTARLIVQDFGPTGATDVYFFLNYRAFNRSGVQNVYAPVLGVPADAATVWDVVDHWVARRLRGFGLYRNRDWLTAAWWGTPADRGMARVFFMAALVGWRDSFRREFVTEPASVWSDTDWNKPHLEKLLRGSFDVPRMTGEEPVLQEMRGLAGTARWAGASFTLVVPPFNFAMVGLDRLIDGEVFRHNVDLMGSIVTAEGGRFLDCSDWQPSTAFSDSVHLTGAGNLALGRQLAEWEVAEAVR
jgi:hypothetical protein